MKEFWKSVEIWQSYRHEFSATFLCGHGVYWLRQLRRCWRSLDTQSAATLVHSFVSSRVNYYNALLAGAPKGDDWQTSTSNEFYDYDYSSCDHRHTRPRLVVEAQRNWASHARLALQLHHGAHCTVLSARPGAAVLDQPLSTILRLASRQHLISASQRLLSRGSFFRDTGCKRTANLLSMLLAHRPGTHCLTIWEIRVLAEPAHVDTWIQYTFVHSVLKHSAH